MKKTWLALLSAAFFLSGPGAYGFENIAPSQTDNERSNETVVRNKTFYKPGKLELQPVIGLMPFNSIVDHYMAGGRLQWHLSDHFGWEIVDATLVLPSITSYAKGLAGNSSDKIQNLQTNKLKMHIGTNLLFSPLYGKLRFFGNAILFFDIYAVGGIGLTQVQVAKLSYVAPNTDPSETILKTSWDPTLNFGFGFKLFMTDVVGLLIDFRDYFTLSEAYGRRRLASNFGFNLGLSVFIPSF